MTTVQTSPAVISAAALTKTDLLRLINGQILALRIPNFVDRATCQTWQHLLQQTQHLARYSNAPDVSVNRIGMTLFETENRPDKLAAYLEEAPDILPLVEQVFEGDNPIHAIHTGIADAWESSCRIEQLNGKMMSPGIIRSFDADPKGGLPPHIDSLLKDLPQTNAFQNMQCQLASNLYFSLSQEGGELEIWDYAPNLDELQQLYNGAYDFIDRSKIPVEAHLLNVQIGELIIFRSNCIHSVRASKSGMRAAASSFIGYYNKQSPLSVWA